MVLARRTLGRSPAQVLVLHEPTSPPCSSPMGRGSAQGWLDHRHRLQGMFITDPADAEAIGSVHGEVFGEVRPAATMVVVKALLRDEWRVEIEAEALMGGD